MFRTPFSHHHHEFTAALRSLCRAPAFAVLAIAMLAVGIGANVTIFSVFDSVVLSPLPYPDAERLIGFNSVNVTKALTQPALSVADFRDVHAIAKSFSALAAFRPDFSSYAPAGSDPQQIVAALVTEDFFSVFGVRPLLGRGFRGDEHDAAASRTAVISHAFWRRHLGQRADVVGATIALDRKPTTIIGVMPASFREPEFVDVWLPFDPQNGENLARDSRFWSTVGRLRPDRTTASAGAEAGTIAAGLAAEYPAINRGWTFTVAPLLEQRVGSMRHSLVLLVAAVGLVLLLACVNLANLMLARGLARMPQFAVRLALGATPAAMARGVLIESSILSLIGGAVGIALAAAALAAISQLLPVGLIPRSHAIRIDPSALTFAAVLSAFTGGFFGLLPAWQVARADVNALLKSAGARGTSSRFTGQVQATLIVAQVAITLVVLSAATTLLSNLLQLQRVSPGFDSRGVLAVRISPGIESWQRPAELVSYYDRLLAEVQRTPGIEAAAIDSSAPLCGISLRYPFWVQGRPRTEGNADEAVFNSVTPDFLRTLQLPLARGRFIEARDDRAAPRVCVINEALARRIFPETDPIGQRLQTVPWLAREYREIVGIVRDTRQDNLTDPPPPQIYVPSAQSAWFFTTILVRTTPGVGVAVVQAALRRADPALPMSITAVADHIALTTLEPRMRAWLFAFFGAIALALSSFGIYASMTFTVRQRTREIGLRMALGASAMRIVQWVLARATRISAGGAIVGLAAALGVAQLLRGFLPGVERVQPSVLLVIAALLVGVSWLASALPAWRAARLNPTHALQHE